MCGVVSKGYNSEIWYHRSSPGFSASDDSVTVTSVDDDDDDDGIIDDERLAEGRGSCTTIGIRTVF